MAEDGFDTHGLDDFIKDMMDLAEKDLPKESRKYLMKEGLKLKNKTKKKAEEVGIPKGESDFYKKFKRGKVYNYEGTMSVRAYNSSNIGHLLEQGHRLISHGKDVGFVKGKFFTEKAYQDFKEQYYKDGEEFIDKMLKEKHL